MEYERSKYVIIQEFKVWVEENPSQTEWITNLGKVGNMVDVTQRKIQEVKTSITNFEFPAGLLGKKWNFTIFFIGWKFAIGRLWRVKSFSIESEGISPKGDTNFDSTTHFHTTHPEEVFDIFSIHSF